MKRSPMKPSTKPLARSPMKRATKPMAQRSAKRRRAYAGNAGRAQFVADYLARVPVCEVLTPVCQRATVDVHESILRSRGGAIVPGVLAQLQRQRFFAICRACHAYVHNHRAESEARGFLDPRNATQIREASRAAREEA